MIYLIFIPSGLVMIYLLIQYFSGNYTIVSKKEVARPKSEHIGKQIIYKVVYLITYKSGKQKFVNKIIKERW